MGEGKQRPESEDEEETGDERQHPQTGTCGMISAENWGYLPGDSSDDEEDGYNSEDDDVRQSFWKRILEQARSDSGKVGEEEG